MEGFEDINCKRIRVLHFDGSNADPIKLRVQRQGSEDDICYIFDQKLPLRKLLEDYSKLENLAYNAIHFLYKGRTIRADRSAYNLGMKNGATIDVFILMEDFEDIISNNNYKRIRHLPFGRSAVNPIKLIVCGLSKTGDFCYLFDRKLPLRHLLEDYCKMENLNYHNMRFIYNGRRVREDLCADDYSDMEYGDEIDCIPVLRGGP